jgi:methenyltetrahydrofolate cyclohydrolase
MRASFLDELARPQPNPGGGAAAAYGALVGLALLEKIVRLELGRRPLTADRQEFWRCLLDQASCLRAELTALIDRDVDAYRQLAAAKASGANGAEWRAAVQTAIECPREIMARALAGLRCSVGIGEHCRRHLVSDLLVACGFLGAALEGAFHIAGANLQLVDEDSVRAPLRGELGSLLGEGLALSARARERFERNDPDFTPRVNCSDPCS